MNYGLVLTCVGLVGVYVTFVLHVKWASWYGIGQSVAWIGYFVHHEDYGLILNSVAAILVLGYGIFNDRKVDRLAKIIIDSDLTKEFDGCIL